MIGNIREKGDKFMRLEEEMYVRTNSGYIYKLSYYDEERKRWICIEENDWYSVYESEIIKASHYLLGKEIPEEPCLIEVGDVLIDKEGHKYPINYEFVIDYNYEYESYEITIDDRITLFFKDGLSVVTKEQFEHRSYKVRD